MSTNFTFESLPDDWRPETLGSLFDVQQGKALSPEARGGASRRPFLRTRNVLWGRLDLGDVDTMSFDDAEASKLTLQDRDLLVCEGGEIGRTAMWRGELAGCLYQNHIHRLRRKTDEVDPLFVMYWLQAAFLQLGLYEGIGNRTTIPNLSGARLKALPVAVPRLREQNAIAELLSKLHAVIETEAGRIAALKQLKNATMARLLREGLGKAPLRITEIGEIPENWGLVRIDAAVAIAEGQVDPRREPYASMMQIGPEDIEEGTSRLLNANTAKESGVISGNYMFRRGEIVYSKIRPYLRKAWLADRDGVCSADMYPLHILQGFVPEYVLAFLLSEPFTRQATAQQARTGIPKVNREQLSAFLIPKPPEDEQVEIGKLIDNIRLRFIEAVSVHRALTELFRAALAALMASRIRLNPSAASLDVLDG